MATRRDLTKKYAREYGRASKAEKGRMLDEFTRGHGLVAGERPAGDPGGVPQEGTGREGAAAAATAEVLV